MVEYDIKYSSVIKLSRFWLTGTTFSSACLGERVSEVAHSVWSRNDTGAGGGNVLTSVAVGLVQIYKRLYERSDKINGQK